MTYRAVMKLADLPVGRMRACRLGEREILLCHTRDGLFAVDNICTHAEARLCEGRLRGIHRLVCPLHGAAFDVRDGRVLAAPAVVPLQCFAVRLNGQDIEVRIEDDPPGRDAAATAPAG